MKVILKQNVPSLGKPLNLKKRIFCKKHKKKKPAHRSWLPVWLRLR
jgi:hypothetical protein